MPTYTDMTIEISQEDFKIFRKGEQLRVEIKTNRNFCYGDQFMYEVSGTDRDGWAVVMGPSHRIENGKVECSIEWKS